MRKLKFLHYSLELIVVIGFLVLGVTILTYFILEQAFPVSVIGILIMAIGVLDFTDFFTWKYATKRRSIQSLVSSVLCIALGITMMALRRPDVRVVCIVWGSCNIAFSIVRIATVAVNITYQPLINGVRIILSILDIIFSILLIINTLDATRPYMLFLGIALLVTAFALFIEFTIHRYQDI